MSDLSLLFSSFKFELTQSLSRHSRSEFRLSIHRSLEINNHLRQWNQCVRDRPALITTPNTWEIRFFVILALPVMPTHAHITPDHITSILSIKFTIWHAVCRTYSFLCWLTLVSPFVVLSIWLDDWMNEWKIYTRFYLEKPTQERGNRTKWQVKKQNKNIIIGDDPIPYLDGAETMDEDSDRS